MDYIKISKEIFERFSPTSIDAEDDIFNAISSFFESAYRELSINLLGQSLTKKLPELIETVDRHKPETWGECGEETWMLKKMDMEAIREVVYEYIVNTALYDAIPQLDLVLTNNGFGIVSTSQVAPASAERIERLRRSCELKRDKCFDVLLSALPNNSLTKDLLVEDQAFYRRTSSLIWTIEDLQNYGRIEEKEITRKTLQEHRAEIFVVERQIRQMISNEQFETILKGLREGESNPIFEQMLPILYGLFSWIFCNNDKQRYSPMEHELLAYMDENFAYFVDYGNSSQYKARHFEAYRNKPEDGCFFF